VEVDKGVTTINSWPCPVTVAGSDAIQFKPNLTMDDKLRVWVPDIFRGTGLTAKEEVELYGVHLLRFVMVGQLELPIRVSSGNFTRDSVWQSPQFLEKASQDAC
jgi:hypothetical protein